MQINEIKYHTPEKASRDMDIYLTVDGGVYDKRTLKDFMSEKAFSFRLKPFLNACGVDLLREFETEDELYKYAMTECTGKSVMVTVGIRNYNGNEYNNVSQYAAVAGSTTSMEDVEAIFGTSASLKVAPESKSEIEKTAEVWKEVAESITDDDVPF